MSLRMAKKKYNDNVHFVPNGADVELFSRSLDQSLPVPADLAKIPAPRIGLIGHMTENVDTEVLRHMASRRRDWSIVVIGDFKGNGKFARHNGLKRLAGMRNIHLLGFKPYERLPEYQKGLDVCILPYKLNEFNQYISPNKVFQHLAGAKPIVSTDLPEVRGYADVVQIAGSKEDFVTKVERTLKAEGSNGTLKEKRLRIARENSVRTRATQRIELLEVVTGKKGKAQVTRPGKHVA
jgi:glycosyltransferase involved in cell wall biosynthesis